MEQQWSNAVATDRIIAWKAKPVKQIQLLAATIVATAALFLALAITPALVDAGQPTTQMVAVTVGE